MPKIILKRFIFFLILLFFTGCGSDQPKLLPLLPNEAVVAFGDSLTFGTGATPQGSYPEQLEKIIGFKVVNAGMPGEETTQALERIDQVLEENLPRLVILCLGGNDIIHKRPFPLIKNNLSKIIKKIRAQGAQVVLIAVPAWSASLHPPEFYAELGKEFRIPVNTTILSVLLNDPDYKSDPVHLNNAGYKKLAEGIADLLKQYGAVEHLYSS